VAKLTAGKAVRRELTKSVVESGLLRDLGDHSRCPAACAGDSYHLARFPAGAAEPARIYP
jgi:hypothetical protein